MSTLTYVFDEKDELVRVQPLVELHVYQGDDDRLVEAACDRAENAGSCLRVVYHPERRPS